MSIPVRSVRSVIGACAIVMAADASAPEAAFRDLAGRFGSDASFAMVQWRPWNAFPPEVRALGLNGVPMSVAWAGLNAEGWHQQRAARLQGQ